MLYRYSSRRENLKGSFLDKKLQGAKQYDRIAGYFSSSIIEVAGEALDSIEGTARILCNSSLKMDDVRTAQQAKNAVRREWCSFEPELLNGPERFKKLYNLLKSGKLEVRIVPEEKYGLIHGKAGIITLHDGTKTAFIGSTNESFSGWNLNYELIWEDDSEESVKWVQEEFDALWNDPTSVPLPEFVIEDIDRISKRQVIYSIDKWGEEPEPAPTVMETPIYRQEFGFWEHQKYFVHLAFTQHQKVTGARYVLADQVGLGKTIQLALSGQLMALYGDKPVLIIVPKTLVWQWQDELINMLDLPSAVWSGKDWIDEYGIRHPGIDEEHIRKCPRRIGIISQGLIVAKSPVVDYLKGMNYECIIVDEAHKARRKKLTPGEESKKADPNNLMEFLLEISPRTKSMILATATPVQLNPIEAWDLLEILSRGSNHVMGNRFSQWRKHPDLALDLAMGRDAIDGFNRYAWEWIRNPLPPAEENERYFGLIRRRLNVSNDEFVISPEIYDDLKPQEIKRCEKLIQNEGFFINHNPFIRHIVRRTRKYLENKIDPETNEPYMKKIEVELFGEREEETIALPPYLKKAYEYAETFCELLKNRAPAGGFIKTLLLRRVGSTVIAGRNTAEKMLYEWSRLAEEETEDEVSSEEIESNVKNLTEEEKECLDNFIKSLNISKEEDPKYYEVYRLLIEEGWAKRGCIVFSQYYDSAYWVAQNLSLDLTEEIIGIYAGGNKSGIFINGVYYRKTKEDVKRMIRNNEIKILLGTDAASEGLNLQALGTLVNLDLPWNPTRLEQRKGRIQRAGQVYDKIWVYNMRYKGSVEDRVHDLLSERFEDIKDMFGQLPDVLEDVWVDVALNEIEEAKRKINEVPKQHPFDIRYQEKVEKVDWENCYKVLDSNERKRVMMKGWIEKNSF